MNVPKLRFKEFSGEWEEKTLGEVVKSQGGKALEKFVSENGTHKFISIGNYSSESKYLDNGSRIVLNNETIKQLLEKDNLVMILNDKTSEGNIIGRTLLIEDDNLYVYNQRSQKIVCEDGVLPKFLYFYANGVLRNTIIKNAQGATQIYINFPVVEKMDIDLPSIDEQEKIAAFFEGVDEKITNQKATITSLEKQKKGLMQKIFSQELRFKNDEGKEFPDWEEKLIKEVCSISTGKSNTQDKVDDGVYPFYVRSSVVEKSDKYLYDEEAVLTVGDGVGTGKIYHYVNGKYDLHQRVYRMYDFVGVSAKYFYFYFSSHFYDRVSKMSAKNSVDSVRLNMIADMRISVPCMGEQTKIVEVLTGVERQLNISKEVLEHWRQIKKGLLQQMFV